jgi:hypothetical protein
VARVSSRCSKSSDGPERRRRLDAYDAQLGSARLRLQLSTKADLDFLCAVSLHHLKGGKVSGIPLTSNAQKRKKQEAQHQLCACFLVCTFECPWVCVRARQHMFAVLCWSIYVNVFACGAFADGDVGRASTLSLSLSLSFPLSLSPSLLLRSFSIAIYRCTCSTVQHLPWSAMAPFGRRMGRMPRYLVALTFGLPAMHGLWFSANIAPNKDFDTCNSCTKLKMVKKIQFEQFSLKLRFLKPSARGLRKS